MTTEHKTGLLYLLLKLSSTNMDLTNIMKTNKTNTGNPHERWISPTIT